MCAGVSWGFSFPGAVCFFPGPEKAELIQKLMFAEFFIFFCFFSKIAPSTRREDGGKKRQSLENSEETDPNLFRRGSAPKPPPGFSTNPEFRFHSDLRR